MRSSLRVAQVPEQIHRFVEQFSVEYGTEHEFTVFARRAVEWAEESKEKNSTDSAGFTSNRSAQQLVKQAVGRNVGGIEGRVAAGSGVNAVRIGGALEGRAAQ